MADVRDDGLIFHPLHMLERDHVGVAGCADVNVAAAERVFDRSDFVTFHRGLERVDRIDLGDDDARPLTAERLGAAFADVAVTADDRDFAGDHDIERAIQPINERMPTAVEIVELRFGNGIVDVDRRNEEPVFLMHFVKAMHAGGRFLRNAAPIFRNFVPAIRVVALDFEQQIFNNLLFPVRRFGFCPIAALFELITFVDQQRRVTAVVHYELRTFPVRMRDRLISRPPIFFERLAFPREHRHAGLRDCRCGVILR